MSVKGHVVALELPFWGHIKPLCALLSRLLRVKPAYVTFFSAAIMRDQIIAEFDRLFIDAGAAELKSLVRVVGLPISPNPFDPDNTLKSAYGEAYKELYAEKPIPVTPGGELLPAVPKPQFVLLDVFLYDALGLTRAASGKSVPVYVWQSAATGALLSLFGPEEFGGLGDLAAKIAKVTETDEAARMEAIASIYRREDGKLIEITGLPPIYDYELKPQISIAPGGAAGTAILCKDINRFMSESDGVVTHTSDLLESGPCTMLKKWLGADHAFELGPLSPPASDAELKKEKETSPVAAEVEAFLDDALQKHGEHSVVYISFGTFWWPAEPEKIWTLIDVLIEQKIPFLFSHASPVAVIPDEIKAKAKDSGLGYLASWLPQQTILRHKAAGWFITHGGQNSLLESLTEGVPLIFWPFDADHPINAINIASVHNAGYELLEVRSGLGLKPIHRLGGKSPQGTLESAKAEFIDLFAKARGEDGKAKRAKAQWFKEQFEKTWEEGGYSANELKKIANIFS